MSTYTRGDRVYVPTVGTFGHVVGVVTRFAPRTTLYTVKFTEGGYSWTQPFEAHALYDAPEPVVVEFRRPEPVALPRPWGPGSAA